MLLTPTLLAICSLACTYLAAAHPLHPGLEEGWRPAVRERRSPVATRTMILVRGQPTNTGYQYARPDRPFSPHPRAAMATYASGGAVATRAYYGAASEQRQGCGHCKQLVDEHPPAPQPEEEHTKAAETPAPEDIPAEVEDPKPVIPERKPKAPKAPKAPRAPPKRRPVAEEEDAEGEGEEEVAPRKGGGRRQGSVYSNFFPVTFGAAGGGRGGLRATDDEDGEEGAGGYGPVTAIANSFSKGRGAIASSSAVAYGHPGNTQPRQSQTSRHRS